MNQQELITAPSSTLTRKQRKQRAEVKRRLARELGVLPGYALGRVKVAANRLPETWGDRITIDDKPLVGVVVRSPGSLSS
jgi:hypothetical protein